ncbi:DUF305 domain-containing protein [Gracilimonas sp.]|uniref:DUF305 domain-containing protein n=1 Tax=Gracilimonas sp. TaxID=1974203 RepID=UPI0028715E88|nr:DUF305 domain-containing protein [Gracilimonas sp.]
MVNKRLESLFGRSTGNFVLLFILVIGFSACTGSGTVTENEDTSDTVEDGRSIEELERLFYARQDSAKMNFTQADTDFMIGMIAHHAQALIMSRLAPENNASSQVQTLAARIINAQKDEIKTMQRWLEDREQPVPEVHIEGLNLMIHGLEGHHADMDHSKMAGMLSDQQLRELADAEGVEFDRLFLKYMIQHHQGAVTMVDKLFSTDGAAQDEGAFRLATDIQVDQKTEIARMQLMLDEITASN